MNHRGESPESQSRPHLTRRSRVPWRSFAVILPLGFLLASSHAAHALTPLQSLYVSPDTAVVLGSTTVLASQVARDEAPVTTVNLGPIPPGANIAAYDRRSNGQQLFVLDVTAVLPGGVIAGPRDVVAFQDPGYTIVFDGAARGIPSGAAIDALATINDDLLLSFDITVMIGSTPLDDADLVRVTPSSIQVFAFITGTGVVDALDLDGLDRLSNAHMLLSFDGSGAAKGINFDDDDLIEYDPSNETFELAYDGSARHAAWAAADLDAVAADAAATATPTATQSPSPSATRSGTPTTTATRTPAFSATPEPTRTEAPPPTFTRVPSTTPTLSQTPSTSSTPTPSATRTPTGTATPSATRSPTLLPGFLAGDANCDDTVTAADLAELIDLIGRAAGACGSDANCDGSTEAGDVIVLVSALFAAPRQCGS